MHYLKTISFLFLAWTALLASDSLAKVAPAPEIKAALDQVFYTEPGVQGFPYQQAFAAAARRYDLPLPFVLAVARGESFFDPQAVSVKGAIGIMQVMPETAADYGVGSKELYDPTTNIDTGVRHLAKLYTRLKDPYLTLGAYYCGCSGLSEDQGTLRADCDEYVRYIHTHLQTVLASAGGKGSMKKARHTGSPLVITGFDNFLDAQNFKQLLNRQLPELQFDLFRTEVRLQDHARFRYQVTTASKDGLNRQTICSRVQASTGFSLCR